MNPAPYVDADGVHVRPLPDGRALSSPIWEDGWDMLLDTPEPCPAAPGVRLLGLCATPTGERFLILDLGAVGAYVGGDAARVARHVALIVDALTASFRRALPPPAAAALAAAVGAWVTACWEETAEALADVILSRLGPTPDGLL